MNSIKGKNIEALFAPIFISIRFAPLELNEMIERTFIHFPKFKWRKTLPFFSRFIEKSGSKTQIKKVYWIPMKSENREFQQKAEKCLKKTSSLKRSSCLKVFNQRLISKRIIPSFRDGIARRRRACFFFIFHHTAIVRGQLV